MSAAESQRNQTLRRVDWRYVLLDPQPARSVSFDHDDLAQAVTAISDRVTPPDESGADCELAVATNPAAKTLRAAWAALKPGGALYSEWTIPIKGRVRRVRHILQAAGFQNVECYWSWPPPDQQPIFWAPLEARGAWRYLLASRPADRQRWQHAARWLARATAYVLHELGLLTPVCAMAFKPDAAPQSLAPGSLTTWLLTQWQEEQLGPRPQELSLLVLTGGKRSTNKIVALVFAGAETQPRFVVKLPRVADSAPGLRHEAAMLETIQARRTTPMPGVPQLVFCDESATHFVLGETVLNGVPLYTQLAQPNYRTWALKATDWLIELAGTPAPASRDQWQSRIIDPILHDFQRTFGPVVDQTLWQETCAAFAQLETLPLVCEQRDFSPWNVLITASGELAVLDWESAELDGLPALDLIYFLTYLAFFVAGAMDSGKYIETYRQCWTEQTSIGQVNTEGLRRYCEALNLDVALMPTLRLFTWLLHARSEYARLTADTGGTPLSETLRQSLFVRLWEEEAQQARQQHA
jgi:aminoglycoside phosphotransferase (APT) family kinase protein